MPNATVRANERCAWRGQALLITDLRGECGDALPLSGFYFRETRFIRSLRLRINGREPWLCEDAIVSPNELAFAYAYPEIVAYGGGGTGQSQDETPVDDDGVPQRAIDLRLRYHVGIAGLGVDATIANRSATKSVLLELSWQLDADFADIQEALAGRREQQAPVRLATAEDALTFEYEHETLRYRTTVHIDEIDGADWRADDSGFSTTVRLAPVESLHIGLRITPQDYVEPYSERDIAERCLAWSAWRDALVRVDIPGNRGVEEAIAANIGDIASFPLLQGQRDEWLAPQAGVPLYPALFGRDAFTCGWQVAMLDRGELTFAALARLGRLQSDRVNDWDDEEPGRIPYQVRQGPLARLGLNPYAAYYADYASPMMFSSSGSRMRSRGRAIGPRCGATGT